MKEEMSEFDLAIQKSKKELFETHKEYMLHTPKERLKLYDEYIKKRKRIRDELARAMTNKIEAENNNSKTQNKQNVLKRE